MKAQSFGVTSSAKTAFLDQFPTSSPARGVAGCALACLRMRSGETDVQGCNGFAFDGGRCHLGYQEPNWSVLSRSDVESSHYFLLQFRVLTELNKETDEDSLYFDLPIVKP